MLTVEQIQKFIDKDAQSKKKKLALEGQRYYEAEHDIKKYTMYFVNADGKLQEDPTKSNIKISHAFFTELVDQEVQYLFSSEDDMITAKDPALVEHLKAYFDDDFYAELSELVTGCIVKGFEYMYLYKDTEGMIRFQAADSLGVVEVRREDAEDEEEHLIYWYIDRFDMDDKPIKKIEVWDRENVSFYSQTGNSAIVPDPEHGGNNPRPHMVYQKNENENELYGESFHFIPFFRLDNNKKRFSGLKPVKALIDDYDLMSCGLSNNIQDMQEALYVVKGFPGNDLDELMMNIKTKKHIGVDDDGGIDVKTIDIPYEARQKKLDLDEKNIYRFGMGFNSAQIGDGNITNIVIKSRYVLLDLKCNKLESRLRQFMQKLIRIVIDDINSANGTAYQVKDVQMHFNRETITNALDNAQIELVQAQTVQTKINALLDAAAKLDDETLVKELCDALDLEYEEIKDRLPKAEVLDPYQAKTLLDGDQGGLSE